MIKIKKYIPYILLVIALTLNFCSQDENTKNSKFGELNLNLKSMELGLTNELGEVTTIPTNELESFFTSNYKEISNMDEDLVLRLAIRNDLSRYYIYSRDAELKQHKTYSDPSGFWNPDTITISDGKTCCSPECTAGFIGEATNNGERSVDMSFRNQRVLGKVVGVKICYTTELTLDLD